MQSKKNQTPVCLHNTIKHCSTVIVAYKSKYHRRGLRPNPDAVRCRLLQSFSSNPFAAACTFSRRLCTKGHALSALPGGAMSTLWPFCALYTTLLTKWAAQDASPPPASFRFRTHFLLSNTPMMVYIAAEQSTGRSWRQTWRSWNRSGAGPRVDTHPQTGPSDKRRNWHSTRQSELSRMRTSVGEARPPMNLFQSTD